MNARILSYEENENRKLILVGMVSHIGGSIYTGHYFCDLLLQTSFNAKSRKFIRFNDLSVRTNFALMQEFSSTGYVSSNEFVILLYEIA